LEKSLNSAFQISVVPTYKGISNSSKLSLISCFSKSSTTEDLSKDIFGGRAIFLNENKSEVRNLSKISSAFHPLAQYAPVSAPALTP